MAEKTEGVIGGDNISRRRAYYSLRGKICTDVQFSAWYAQLSDASVSLRTEEKMMFITATPPDKYFYVSVP
jgi:hypothetical protein